VNIGYARVSTARQGESLDTQRDALLGVGCDAQHFFSDTVSGSKWQRPGLTNALAYMRPGDTLVVTRLDRLGRSVRETVTTIADLAERDINVRVLEPALDTSKPTDKVVVNVMASLAEWERDLLIARTKEGVAHARAQGRVGGRPKALTADQTRQVRALHASGENVTALSRSFGVSRQTIYRALEPSSGTKTVA
jgi:DNA invertase